MAETRLWPWFNDPVDQLQADLTACRYTANPAAVETLEALETSLIDLIDEIEWTIQVCQGQTSIMGGKGGGGGKEPATPEPKKEVPHETSIPF